MPQTEKSAAAGRFAGRADPSVARPSGRPIGTTICRIAATSTPRCSSCSSRSRAGWKRARRSTRSSSSPSIRPGPGKFARSCRPCGGWPRPASSSRLTLAPPLADDRDHEGRRVVGDFRIVREIGRGGMGIVYEAEQAALGRRVALKVLPLAAALDPRAIQRFQLEAQVAGWLQHPRIVPVYAVGLVDEVPYFAMQFIEGGSLGTLIAELRGLAERGSGSAADHASGDSPSALALGLLTGRFAPSSRDGDTDRHARGGAATGRRVVPNDPWDREAHREPRPCRWASSRCVGTRHHPTERFRARLIPTRVARTARRSYGGRFSCGSRPRRCQARQRRPRRRFGATRICAPSPAWASRPPRRSATHTTRGSFTATSSRPTCCWTSAATCGSPTSAWPTCRGTPA